mgnify:FL=1
MENKATRLNYVIPNDIYESLESYCKYTGRTASDVIRQLIVDYNNGMIPIGKGIKIEEGRRSSLKLNSFILDAFDKKIEKIGTRGSVISKLLSSYLLNRLDKESSYEDSYTLLKELMRVCEARKLHPNVDRSYGV